MMTKGFVVTEGSYLDYTVLCVFEKRKDAKEFVADYTSLGHYAQVEEFPLFVSGTRPVVFDIFRRSGVIEADSSMGKEHEIVYKQWAVSEPTNRQAEVNIFKTAWGAYRFSVTGHDKQAVDQSFSHTVVRIRTAMEAGEEPVR